MCHRCRAVRGDRVAQEGQREPARETQRLKKLFGARGAALLCRPVPNTLAQP